MSEQLFAFVYSWIIQEGRKMILEIDAMIWNFLDFAEFILIYSNTQIWTAIEIFASNMMMMQIHKLT